MSFGQLVSLCHLLKVDDKAAVCPVHQLYSVSRTVVENVDSTIRRHEIIKYSKGSIPLFLIKKIGHYDFHQSQGRQKIIMTDSYLYNPNVIG